MQGWRGAGVQGGGRRGSKGDKWQWKKLKLNKTKAECFCSQLKHYCRGISLGEDGTQGCLAKVYWSCVGSMMKQEDGALGGTIQKQERT